MRRFIHAYVVKILIASFLMTKNSELMSVGGRPRHSMKAAGKTQKQLAEHLSSAGYACDEKTIAHWCRIGTPIESKTGRRLPHPGSYAVIADFSRINPAWLIFHGVLPNAPLHPDQKAQLLGPLSPEDYIAWQRWQRLDATEKRIWIKLQEKLAGL